MTVILIIMILIPFTGQKSSKAFIKNVKTFEVVLQPTSAVI